MENIDALCDERLGKLIVTKVKDAYQPVFTLEAINILAAIGTRESVG